MIGMIWIGLIEVPECSPRIKMWDANDGWRFKRPFRLHDFEKWI